MHTALVHGSLWSDSPCNPISQPPQRKETRKRFSECVNVWFCAILACRWSLAWYGVAGWLNFFLVIAMLFACCHVQCRSGNSGGPPRRTLYDVLDFWRKHHLYNIDWLLVQMLDVCYQRLRIRFETGHEPHGSNHHSSNEQSWREAQF